MKHIIDISKLVFALILKNSKCIEMLLNHIKLLWNVLRPNSGRYNNINKAFNKSAACKGTST